MSDKPKHAGGRPSKYNLELAQTICRRLADGETLIAICKDAENPDRHTIFNWRDHFPEFDLMYQKARKDQADHYAEQALEVALHAKDAALGRLAWDALRWTA